MSSDKDMVFCFLEKEKKKAAVRPKLFTGISHFPGSLPGLLLPSIIQVSVDNSQVFGFPLNLSLL